jgi:hypothetical protein
MEGQPTLSLHELLFTLVLVATGILTVVCL